ncbi:MULTISPECIES: LytR/AlgR family response regulator transcription factor [Streptococcus]|uniref:LytR/AlgR family response regulator transcription factor n=1 Tax=Streptococcus caledonicus TaxID=2614158 RepID=A0ABW0UBM3_9STRE|nr:LytTR family DNA-binding domain-containing protein [Streptococcus sp. S784/96/1]
MKFAIVEDQKKEQEILASYIKKSCSTRNISVEVDFFNDGIHIISDYTPKYDVIYLDVEMAVLDGMSAARKIREYDKDVLIVFVTNHSGVAIHGYSVEAIDFLLKPLTQFVFEEHFKKILRKLPNQEEKVIFVKSKGQTIKIKQNDILYVENEGHYIYIHTNKEIITTLNSMKNMEQLLDKKLFFRSNNCYIVNLSHIEKVDGNLSYIQGERLQISRPRKKAFMEALTNFIGDEIL